MSELTLLSAVEQIEGVKTRKFSCVELMQAHIDKIRIFNPLINAIVQLRNEEDLMSLARKTDQLVSSKQASGKLHGLPISIKDHFKVKDFIVSRGCVGLENNRCIEDASVVGRLKREGAIIIGITNMPELGPAFETDNDLYGQTKNPYDLTKIAGGSSGGEAASIASGCSAIGLGSDGGGSIRLPAHFCGIVGIKPTQHLIPYTGMVPTDGGIGMQFSTAGPMARFVRDLEMILPILAGTDGIDPYVPPQPLPLQVPKLFKSMRIGYIMDSTKCSITEDTRKVMEDAVKVLTDAGVDVQCVDFLDIGYIGRFMWETFFMGGDRGRSYMELLKSLGRSEPSKTLQYFFDAASSSKAFDAFEMRRRFVEADQIRMRALQNMRDYDALITPVCATPAKAHETTHTCIDDFSYAMAFNLLGWPACVVRCGETHNKLPIGLQIVAKPWHDNSTLKVAAFLENQFGGWVAPKVI